MALAAKGDLPNPYEIEFPDYQDNKIVITINYNATTKALQASSVFRDAACVYTKVFIGVGTDGSPNTTTKAFNVPAGTTNITVNAFNNRGLSTIDDILALQITAGQ